jgi:hypothetical protein
MATLLCAVRSASTLSRNIGAIVKSIRRSSIGITPSCVGSRAQRSARLHCPFRAVRGRWSPLVASARTVDRACRSRFTVAMRCAVAARRQLRNGDREQRRRLFQHRCTRGASARDVRLVREPTEFGRCAVLQAAANPSALLLAGGLCSDTEAQEQPAPVIGSITGRIVDSDTGEPLVEGSPSRGVVDLESCNVFCAGVATPARTAKAGSGSSWIFKADRSVRAPSTRTSGT